MPRLKRSRGRPSMPQAYLTPMLSLDGNLQSREDTDPLPSAKRLKTNDKESAPFQTKSPGHELAPSAPHLSPAPMPLREGNLQSIADIDPSPSAERLESNNKDYTPLQTRSPSRELTPSVPPTPMPLSDGNPESMEDINPTTSTERLKTNDKEQGPLQTRSTGLEPIPMLPAVETVDLTSKDETEEDEHVLQQIPQFKLKSALEDVKSASEDVKTAEIIEVEKVQEVATVLPSTQNPQTPFSLSALRRFLRSRDAQQQPEEQRETPLSRTPTVLDRGGIPGTTALPSTQYSVAPSSRKPTNNDRGDIPGSSYQLNEDDEEENPEVAAINAAYRRVDGSRMEDLNDAETAWMDELIHSRPSTNAPQIDRARQVELNREDLMAYLAAVDNRPGYVKRKQKSKEAKESKSSLKPEKITPLEVETQVDSPVGQETQKTQDMPVNDEPGDGVEEDGESARIREEKERIVEAAKSLRCKCRRRKVTRRELLEIGPAADGEADSNTIMVGESEETPNEDRVIIADGPDGQPRRYRLVEEMKRFWTVRGMETSLLDHQILGVEWMAKTIEQSDRPPRAGLLCDQMGLGKTMQVIATMVLNKPPEDIGYRGPKVTLIITPAALMEQWKNEIQMHTKPATFKVAVHHGSQKIKSLTLLKSQDVVITSYNTVMFSHPSPKRPRQNMTKEEVEEWWDQEWESRGMFHRMKFWRICLDESHWIKNHRARMSAACMSLRSVHKWSITGTPIQNSLQDMYAQFRFLDHPRFSDLPSFKSVFGTSMSGGAARAAKAMQVELSRLMMRRTKDELLCGRKLLDLTPKMIITTEVEFGPEERCLYNIYEQKTIEEVNRLRRASKGDKFFLSVLALLMRLRQICDSPVLVLDSILKHMTLDDLKQVLATNANENNEDEDDDKLPSSVTTAFGSPRKRRKLDDQNRGLQQIIELAKVQPAGDATQCSICLDAPEDPVLTNCRHCFCQGCISNVIQNAAVQGTQSLCPLCKMPVAGEDLRAYVEGFGAQTKDTDGEALAPEASLDNKHWLDKAKTFVPSAKLAALKAQLNDWKDNRPDDKIIIFSQFTKMLDLVWLMCEKEGWETTRYQGNTSMKTREEALKRFKTDPDCWIMLTSLRAGGVGLNLTEANLVVSIDMWWNAAVEHQAFDRVHRLGQRKEVHVKRLMVKQTVEQRILALQEAKLKIAEAAMGEGLVRVKNLSMKELMGLFGKVIMGADGIEMVVRD